MTTISRTWFAHDGLPTRQWSLRLLGCWQLLIDDEAIDVGARQQRLITYLALQGTQSRRSIAGRLWPESASERAGANLRASLFKISHEQPGLIHGSTDTVGLEPSVHIDVTALRSAIDAMLEGGDSTVPTALIADLSAAELLPGWCDDWVLPAQERFDHQRLLALEAATRRYLRWGDLDRAVEVATTAVRIAPLRESAYLLLMQAHLDAGNQALAARVHQQLCNTLADELGVEPCMRFEELVETRLRRSRVPVTFL